MRHIAILGMSFCGSTLLGRVLGSLPGVANIGESHWIASKPLPGHDSVHCVTCGETCPYLTPKFMESMRSDPSGWYARIARQLRTDLLVSSDKNFDLLSRLDPSLDFDAVLLFRFPPDCWRSYQKSASIPDEDGPMLHRSSYYWYWTNFYGHATFHFRNRGRFVLVDYDAFVEFPREQLERLCEVLRLPYSEDALEYWRAPQHALGGNGGVNAVLKTGVVDNLRIRPRATQVSREEVIAFTQHPTVSHMHSYLMQVAASGKLNRES